MVRTTLGAEVETTVAVQGAESVARVDASITSNVSDGGRVTSTIRSPAGTVFEIVSFRFQARNPGGTSGGRHFFSLEAEGSTVIYLSGNASGDQQIQYNTQHLVDADMDKQPPTVEAQLQAVRGIRADSTAGIDVRYGNESNATQTQDITIELIARRITVSET